MPVQRKSGNLLYAPCNIRDQNCHFVNSQLSTTSKNNYILMYSDSCLLLCCNCN